ncbi:MAG: hypothetical protein DWI59_04420, partial [Chloroflexi bacterium]
MVGRRSVLRGIGVGALGLTGAALIGCGGGGAGSAGGAKPAATSVVGSTRGQGLPMTAPKVA